MAVVGGESVQTRGMGMTGAVDLAALAALHAGAGRVMVSYLNQALMWQLGLRKSWRAALMRWI